MWVAGTLAGRLSDTCDHKNRWLSDDRKKKKMHFQNKLEYRSEFLESSVLEFHYKKNSN